MAHVIARGIARGVLSAAVLAPFVSAACGRSKHATAEPDTTAGEAGAPSGAGGAPASGGSGGVAAGTGGADASCALTNDCPTLVTFEVTLAGDGDPTRFCTPCGEPSFSIKPLGGAALDLTPPNCETLCSSCELALCHPTVTCPSKPLREEPVPYPWSGVSYGLGACGPSATPCSATERTVSGRFVATFCAARGSPATDGAPDDCVPSSAAPSCTQVEFELPSAEPIDVVLPP